MARPYSKQTTTQGLECELQPNLTVPRANVVSGILAEGRVRQVGNKTAGVFAVERIECIQPHFDLVSFAECLALEEREAFVFESQSTNVGQDVGIAEGERRGETKSRAVEGDGSCLAREA